MQNQRNHFDQSQKTQTIWWTNQNSKQIHVAGAKRGKTTACMSELLFILRFIGWESGLSFLNQSQSVETKVNANYFRVTI